MARNSLSIGHDEDHQKIIMKTDLLFEILQFDLYRYHESIVDGRKQYHPFAFLNEFVPCLDQNFEFHDTFYSHHPIVDRR